MNIFKQFQSGLKKTSTYLSENLFNALTSKKFDQETLEKIESILLSSDINLEVTSKLIEKIQLSKISDPENPNSIIKLLINELEFIRGEIWANIWKNNEIITINPISGSVTSILDISNISEQKDIEDVPNGIAWDKINDRIYITGKNWDFIYLLDI